MGILERRRNKIEELIKKNVLGIRKKDEDLRLKTSQNDKEDDKGRATCRQMVVKFNNIKDKFQKLIKRRLHTKE